MVAIELIKCFTFQYGEINATDTPAQQTASQYFTFQYGEINAVEAGIKKEVSVGCLYIPIW